MRTMGWKKRKKVMILEILQRVKAGQPQLNLPVMIINPQIKTLTSLAFYQMPSATVIMIRL